MYKLGVWATRADARRQLPVQMGLLVIIWKTSDYWLPDGRMTSFIDSPSILFGSFSDIIR